MNFLPETTIGLYIILAVWFLPTVLMFFMQGPSTLKSRSIWIATTLLLNWFTLLVFSVKYVDIRNREQQLMDQLQDQ